MGNDFMAYLDRHESMAFFSAYPLVYALVRYIAGVKGFTSSALMNRLPRLLPYAYALTGTLFLGMIVGNLYPDYQMEIQSL